MTRYYSLDRRGYYSVDNALGLYRENPFLDDLHAEGGERYSEGNPSVINDFVAEFFPRGISLHGWDHLTYQYIIPSRGTDVRRLIESSIELTVELLRRLCHQSAISRFESYFAFDNLDRVKEFRQATQRNDLKIYELQSDLIEQRDQAWLTMGYQASTALYCAEMYWKRLSSKPDVEYLLKTPVCVVREID